MTDIVFYNTLTRQKENFAPIDAENVRMYVCGPTVYDYAHIGNARPVIVFDVVYRLLRAVYGKNHVRYVRNITDVDDKINARAARDYADVPLNNAIAKLTKQTEAQFHADVKALNCLLPDSEPRATRYIEQMKQMIERLVQNGCAYVAENHVLFDVAAMNKAAKHKSAPRYGQLSKRPLQELLAGARVDVAAYKRGEQDFVLWKPSKTGEPGWDSPCDIPVLGRPGWHIECSAMSMGELLVPYGGGLSSDTPGKNCFDIHGGGHDLIFPHHENEIAQSCCALNTDKMANFWLHNGFVQVEGQKMSKSLGNFITIRQILESRLLRTKHWADKKRAERWAGLSMRFAMLQTHYREPLDWTQKRLEESSEELYRWYRLLQSDRCDLIKIISEKEAGKQQRDDERIFGEALFDDLNMPAAITHMRRFYKQKNSCALLRAMALLGLGGGNSKFPQADEKQRKDNVSAEARQAERELLEESEWLLAANSIVKDKEIKAQIAKRAACIAEKNWAEADKIRNALLEKGIKLQDSTDKKTGKRTTKWDYA